jgi:hypothetical protein
LAEKSLLEAVNKCRAALNQFFSTMSGDRQASVREAFDFLRMFRDTCSIIQPPPVVCPASFIAQKGFPKHRSDIIMPRIDSAWGFAELQEFSQEDMDKIGACAVGQVLEMLQKRDPMGIEEAP